MPLSKEELPFFSGGSVKGRGGKEMLRAIGPCAVIL
jgi:hypothetical protein